MPDEYQLQLERLAQRGLSRLPRHDYERLEQAIDGLVTDPRPRGTLKLSGRLPLFRLRVGEYRIIYSVFDQERLVKIVDVQRRTTQTYRRLT